MLELAATTWVKTFEKGRYVVRFTTLPHDILAAQRLRYKAFVEPGSRSGSDADAFDETCIHALIEEKETGRLICCFRLLLLQDGSELGRCYASKCYDLGNLETFPGRMVEMGRFCIDPEFETPEIARVAWAAMTRFVDENHVRMIFGCSSFKGTDAERYLEAFALLKDRHLAPAHWAPGVKAAEVFRFAEKLRGKEPNRRLAAKAMPPLLKTYLAMGGWISDHAVIDNELKTLHVFTGVEVDAIPSERVRLLRASAE